jgi:hypothetical protein
MKNNEERWSIWENPGNLMSTRLKDVSELVKDLGVGPAIHLLTYKAFIKLFLALTILNLPMMYIYHSGSANFEKNTSGA